MGSRGPHLWELKNGGLRPFRDGRVEEGADCRARVTLGERTDNCHLGQLRKFTVKVETNSSCELTTSHQRIARTHQ